LVIEPSALAAARRSLEESGFSLLGEVHGALENPLVIRALMRAFGLSGLALEWPEDLASVAGRFSQARGWPITRCGLTIITYTVEPHSASEQALNFLASWSAQASPVNPRESETIEETE
jgi:hypothetical protein